jgi:ABC-type transport system involved in multi-copper enzyme maturation permease subunit
MFVWLTNPSVLLAGIILAGVQLLAAVPWLWAIDPRGAARTARDPKGIASAVAVFLGAGVLVAMLLGYKGESGSLEWYGRYVYGSVLHLQLIIDVCLLLPQLVVLAWPKGGAVALAAYREGWRQPMFWLIVVGGTVAIWASVVIPYFTFGDDYKMMKQIGFDVIMLATGGFGVLASSMSISEEIEGRTAVTLMSKPVNRRQFLLGKFVGILMACLAVSMILGWNLNSGLRVMREFDPINNAADPNDLQAATMDKVVDPMTIQGARWVAPAFASVVPSPGGRAIARGAGLWFGDTVAHSLGIALGFGQVMILTAIATALATRTTFVVNIVICLVVYALGNLAPVIVRQAAQSGADADAAVRLVAFIAQMVGVVFPALEFYTMGPAIIRETPLQLGEFAGYVGTVLGYSVIYTAIALLIGLLMFEDRDLA